MKRTLAFEYPIGSTPLSLEELQELIPPFIHTQAELNAAEQMNIAKAQIWLQRHKKITVPEILDEIFLKKLHQQMYGKVWKWAGNYRKSDKNIGVEWIKIPIFLRQLLEDIKFQLAHKTYPESEIVSRFHHRLVWIHLFPNGNGRHARVLSDFLLSKINGSSFTWGGGDLKNYASASETRKKYIQALKEADKGNYSELLDLMFKN